MTTLIIILTICLIALGQTITEFVSSFNPTSKLGQLGVKILTKHYSLIVFAVVIGFSGSLTAALVATLITEFIKS